MRIRILEGLPMVVSRVALKPNCALGWAICAIGLSGLVDTAYGAGGQRPIVVSPGTATGFTSVSDRCPTFSWGLVENARSYELVVYQVDPNELTDPDGGSSLEFSAQLPGSAQSWTPDLGQCLAPGNSYAWSIRAGTPEGETAWSEAGLFRVAAGPSVGKVEEALAVLRRYVAEGGEVSVGAAAELAASGNRSVVEASAAVSDDDRDRGSKSAAGSETVSARMEALRKEMALRQQQSREPSLDPISLGSRALLSETLGLEAASSARTVTPPASYSLVLDGDVALDGNLFKEGVPLLHTDGGRSYGNTALGLDAMVSTTPGAGGASLVGRSNTALGTGVLYENTTGSFNTASGNAALNNNIAGSWNTASGVSALVANTTGSYNTASGGRALIANRTGSHNTAAGYKALRRNTSGRYNTAIGSQALDSNTTGSGNIAVGLFAGSFADTGHDNIFIGHSGSSGISNTIRIGNLSDHQIASIAGDLGLGTESPTNRLHARDFINDFGTPTNHVGLIENTSAGTSPDVLALKVGTPAASVGAAHNFITFFGGDNTSMGALQGNGAGGVVLAGPGNDYAEWLRRLDPDEVIEPGDVVGLFGDRVSKHTLGADGVMVVSSASIVAGNDPGEGNRTDYSLIAFVGQAEVRVDGPVQQGDYLMASGRGDGKAVAVPPEELDAASVVWVVGRALTARSPETADTVHTLVGVADPRPLAAVLALQAEMITAQQHELDELRNRLAAIPILKAKR